MTLWLAMRINAPRSGRLVRADDYRAGVRIGELKAQRASEDG